MLDVTLKPQKEFPRIKEYKKIFPVTEKTIFAYDTVIYCNYALPEDLVTHETVHLKRQEEIGADVWVDKYLSDVSFRLNEELLAYRKQLQSIKDKEIRGLVKIESAKHLSSALYGNIVSFDDAMRLLRV